MLPYPPLDHVSPREERRLRREWKAEYKARGMQYPRLHTLGFVELDRIKVPEWAWYKRIKGLTADDKHIWLRRILARELFREDQDAGGHPKITFAPYRPCKICKRPLIGPEAEQRFLLDLTYAGKYSICGPDCVETERIMLEAKAAKRARVK